MEITIRCNKREESDMFYMLKQINPELVSNFNDTIEMDSDPLTMWKCGGNIELHIDTELAGTIMRKIAGYMSMLKAINSITDDSIADISDKLGEVEVKINGHNVDFPDDVDTRMYDEDAGGNMMEKQMREVLGPNTIAFIGV